MRLLLDTVTFIRAVKAPDLLSKRAMAAMEHSEAVLELSAISMSEIAIKHVLGKIDLSESDVEAGISRFDIHVLPLRTGHALRMFRLQAHHSDPFDRQIIAQALEEGIPIVTCDDKFRLYRGIKVIW